MLNTFRDHFTNFMQMRTLHRHGSRVGWRIAPKYTRYLEKCRACFSETLPPAGDLSKTVADFRRDGIASFWTPETAAIATAMYDRIRAREATGERLWADVSPYGNCNYEGNAYVDFPQLEELFRGALGTFLLNYFGTYFKIFYGTLFKSVRTGDLPTGSQLWHSDGGPGTCVNVAFYLHDVLDDGAGALHALPWSQSVEIYEREFDSINRMAKERGIKLRKASRDVRRDIMTSFYKDAIDARYRAHVRAPKGRAGLVVPFLNNLLHFGGYPAQDRERIALIVHCYPSDRPADFERYRRDGFQKTTPYPIDPAAPF